METNFNFFNSIFHVICVSFTLWCVGICFYNYHLDLDVSLVEHRTFGVANDYITPAISLCLFDPFSDDKFNESFLGFDKKAYTSFLAGNHWDERMQNTNFDNITKSLDEYLNGYWVQWRNLSWKFVYPDRLPQGFAKPYLSYSGFNLEWLIKCYSIDIPVDAMLFGVFFKRSFFPNARRPRFQGFGFVMHYPNQFLNSVSSMKMSWPKEIIESNHSLSMEIKVNNFEITIRRNSRKNTCNPDLKNDDYIASETSLDKIKCYPPYYNWKSKHPICKTSHEIANAKQLILKTRSKLQQPCKSAEKITYEHQDLSVAIEEFYKNEQIMKFLFHSGVGKEKLRQLLTTGYDITVLIPESKYKAIVHKQAYDITSLIGNSGGYIGLFLGYTVIQIPVFIRTLVRKINSFWRKSGDTNEKTESSNISTKGIQDEFWCSIETHSSKEKQMGIEDYIYARLKMIEEFEHKYVDHLTTELKLLLRLEKSSMLRLSRKY